MTKKLPIIGFTLDHEQGGEGKYSKMPFYAIRENYLESAAKFGAIPMPIPYQLDLVNNYLDIIDALVTIGGNFDIPPAMYGQKQHNTVTTKPRRTQFEFAMTEGAIKRKMPILGICGGEQLINVVLGGSLIQHIPDSFENCLAHEQPTPRTGVGHNVDIVEGTLLHKIIGNKNIGVNSAHHQAVDKVGDGVVINSYAPDGVIEGIEYPSHPFCLGVQWHPEYSVTENDDKIWEAFVMAAAEYGVSENAGN
jgi:putative glutamine amidotransferase